MRFFPFAMYAPEGESGAAVEAPVVEAAVESAAPVATEAAAVEAPASAESTLATEAEPSLLAEAEGKKVEAEAAVGEEPAKSEEVKEGEATAEKAAEPAPEPVKFEDFTLPEGVTLQDEALSAFKEVMGDQKLSRQEQAQKLVDLYVKDAQAMQQNALKAQQDHWRQLNDGWKNELRQDAELGGNRLTTTLSIAKAVVEEFGGSKQEQSELFNHFNANGMGNYKPFVKMMHNIGVALNVFEDKIVPAPPSSTSQPADRQSRWYGASKKAG